MAATHPWWWTEVENPLCGIGGKWDGEEGTNGYWRDTSIILGTDEMMRDVCLGSPS